MKKHYGKCALCGKECELTFEHIPPKGAFNSRPARPVSGTEIFKEEHLNDDSRMPWDTTGMHYDNQQQGMGRYSLCDSCNNSTGNWYGDAYVTFARTVHTAMQNHTADDPNRIGFKDAYPLRIIKQNLSMFCSILRPDDPRMDEIRNFVLDKNAVGLDKKRYKLCLYFTNTTVMKHSGLTIVLWGDLSNLKPMAMAEITAYPIGAILYFDPTETWEYQGTDIMECADFAYEDKADIIFPWIIKEMNDIYPETFRSRDEIRECIKQKTEGDS